MDTWNIVRVFPRDRDARTEGEYLPVHRPFRVPVHVHDIGFHRQREVLFHLPDLTVLIVDTKNAQEVKYFLTDMTHRFLIAVIEFRVPIDDTDLFVHRPDQVTVRSVECVGVTDQFQGLTGDRPNIVTVSVDILPTPKAGDSRLLQRIVIP